VITVSPKKKVSAYPQEVTFQMVYNFIREGAGINVLAKHIGAEVIIVDMGVASEFPSDKGIIIKNKLWYKEYGDRSGNEQRRSGKRCHFRH